MFEVSTRVEFKGWKEFESRNPERLDIYYVAFMKAVGKKADEIWHDHTPVGWEDKGPTYNMQQHIHIGEVERHPWGYAIETGILPILDAALEGEDPMYPRYVDEGTGIYNLKKSRGRTFIARGQKAGNFASVQSGYITPKTEPRMVFDVPLPTGGETTVFAKKTRGQRGQHFSDAVTRELNAWIRIHKKELKIFLRQAVKDNRI